MKNINSVTRGWGLLEEFLAKQRASMANSFISKRQRRGKILDIGCGSYPYFLVSTKFAEKYGIDPVLNTLKIKNGEINLKKIDVTKQKLSFANNYFDAVTMLAVFEHIEHDKLNLVLTEIKRVLKKDGIFIITTPAPWADRLLHLMARINLISEEEIHEHKTHHSKSEIYKLLATSGFKKNNVKSGFFEIYMNMWFTASK